ncbi:MAG TPA: putative baseplate assembly protein [Myxococcota bacterium]|jgi:hypothetical protein|nr:putative baseplate assembly protein [Myxococcota bacterium]
MIPSPNLDDRKFEDIVAEAMRLIPQYCPEWTNHNSSDPGVTLIELFAWMTEMIIYRLNKVTEKNYLAFLDLIGINLQPPQPAKTLLTFFLAEGSERQVVPTGTQVSTSTDGGGEPIVFETERDLVVSNTKMMKCFSQHRDQAEVMFSDNTPFLGRPQGFDIFLGAKNVERIIYLGDERFENFNETATMMVEFAGIEAVEHDFPRLLEWEYWNGHRWQSLIQAPMTIERGQIAFYGPPAMDKGKVNEIENFWIRGRLRQVPKDPSHTKIDTVKSKIDILGEGVAPDVAYTNIEANVFFAVDMGKNFQPFGKEPKIDYTFYLAQRDLLSQAGAIVRIEVLLSDPAIIDPPNPSDLLQVIWEYWNGKKWYPLGKSTPFDTREGEDAQFVDGTHAFTENGTVQFRRPNDMQPCLVNGEESFWIRARVETGDYGVAGTYELVGDSWVWRDERPCRPPSLRSINFKYAEEPHPLQKVLLFNDFRFEDVTEIAGKDHQPFQAFNPVAEESPSLYLGFDRAFPNDPTQVYFNTTKRVALEIEHIAGGMLAEWVKEREEALLAEQRVVWEYWNGKIWGDLFVKDGTRNFTQSGFIEFVGPKDFRRSRRFNENLFWVRARLEMGGYDQLPRLTDVLLNTVEAANHVTLRNETLGSSDGTPSLTLTFSNTPVLDGQHIWIREREEPSAREREVIVVEEGEEAVQKEEDALQEQGWWVRWHQVDSFYESSPTSRHYVKDPVSGRITFGDGRKGMIPPYGKNNVRARMYKIGGGAKGNVNAGAVVNLRKSIAYIDHVGNAYPAAGGSDLESIEDAKARGPHVIKSRNRAVTAEDFEWLTLQASSSIARVKCLASTQHEGEVTVLVLPKDDEKRLDLTKKLVPSLELLQRIKLYLDDRRLVTTIVHVVPPKYVELSVTVDVVRKPTGASDRLKKDIERALRTFLHPLRGGRNGKGWPWGRSLYKADLYHVVEDIEGVDYVDNVRLFDEDRRVHVEHARLEPDELLHVVEVDVVEKSREQIG